MENLNKIFIYVAIAILAVAILGYLIFVFQKEAPRVELSYTGEELAKKIESFLAKAQKEDGSFNLFYVCSALLEEGCLPEQVESPLHAGQIILAFYDLFLATGDTAYKEKADLGMKFVMEKCPEDPLMCEWNFFPLYVYYKDTQDPQYLEGMLSVSEKFLADKPFFNDFVDGNTGVKLAMLYDVTGDVKYRDRLDRAAEQALNLDQVLAENGNKLVYTVDDFAVRTRAVQTVWATLIPAYKATGKQEYLQASQDFFDKADTLSNLDAYDGGFAGTFALVVAVDTLTEISELSGGVNSYLQEARSIAQKLIDEQLDTAETPKFTGDYGFLFVKLEDNSNAKGTLLTGWLVRLLLRM